MKYPPFSWLRLTDDFHPSPSRVWFSLNRLPKPQEPCHVRLHIGGANASITDPFEVVQQNNLLLAREQKVLELFLKIAKPLKTKMDFSLDHASFGMLLPYVSVIPFEVFGEGVISHTKEPAFIKAILKDPKSTKASIEFILVDNNDQIINNASFYGDINAYVIDEKLRLYLVNPNLTQSQAQAILFCLPLYLSGLLNQQSRYIFYTLSRMGLDFGALEKISVNPDKSQIVLRLILTLDDLTKKMCARAHLVTEISYDDFVDETEIKSLGFIPEYQVAAQMELNEERFNEEIAPPKLLKRPHEQEVLARDFLYHLGASPARLHDGFLLYGEQALKLLKSISFKGGLPSFIKLDENARPNIIELDDKIKLLISSDEEVPRRVNVNLSLSKEFDATDEDFSAIINSKEPLVVLDSDTLVVVNDETKNVLKYLCEMLSFIGPSDVKSKSVAQIALLINSFRNNITIEAAPSLLSFLHNFSIKQNDSDRILPKGLQTNLRPYQLDAVAWLSALNRSGLGGLLGDEMGLGKTLMVLTHLARLKELNKKINPALVVCPTSVMDVWIDEAHTHLPNLKVIKWHGPERSLDHNISNADIIVTSYAILRRDYDTKLKPIHFSTLVLDEAQYVRNQQTDSFKSAKSIHCDHRIALTGTPIENHLSDLYNILDCVEDGILGPKSVFERQFVVPIEAGSSDAASALKMLIAPVVIRRRKAEVENELPPKIENLVHCTLSPKQRELYNQYLQSISSTIVNALSKTTIKTDTHFSLLSVLTRLRQICCHPSLILGEDESYSSGKLDAIKEIMQQCLESGRKMIIYSQFLKMQEHIVNLAAELDPKGALWLHGSTKNRDEIIKSFQSSNGPNVIVVSLKAGGTGITLTAADTVIFADPWWNPAVEDQAVDRAHRIGQKKTVHVIRIIADDSIESEVLALAQKKRQAAMSVLHGGFKTSVNLTQDEVKNLLLREVDRISQNNSSKASDVTDDDSL